MNCLSWTKLIKILIHLKYWHYHSPYPEVSLPNFTLDIWNPSSTQSPSCSLSVSLFCPTSFNHTLPQLFYIPSYTQIIIPYGSNTFLIKKTRVFKSRFSLKVKQHGQKQLKTTGRCSLIFTTSLVHKITPTISTKTRFSTSINFHLPIPLLFVHRITLTNPINTTYLYTSAIFHLPNFAQNNPINSHQKYFPYLNHLANSGCVIRTRELESLVTTNTVWFSPFFFKVRAVIMELTFTDTLLLRFRKFVYCR